MGKRDPFADLEPLVQRVYAYVAYRVGEPALAEQITAEAFARALRHRAAFDPRSEDPVGWLVGIARSLVDLHHGALAGPRSPAAGLAGAVSTLEDPERELIALRFGSGLDAAQIGAVLDLSPTAVERAVERALERLRQSLRPRADSVAL